MKRKLLPVISIIVFSIILWGSVSLSDEYTATVELPVEVVNVPNEYALAGLSDDKVSVNIQGEGWQLVKFYWGSDQHFTLSAKQDSGRKTIFTQKEVDMNPWMSTNLRVHDVNPAQVSFNVEKLARKKIKVIPDLNINYRTGYGLTSEVKVRPDSIVVRGPESALEEIETINTQKTEFTELGKSVSAEVGFEELPFIEPLFDKVTVSFNVQKIVDKSFADILVETRRAPPARELQLFPPRISIVLRGGISLLGKLESEDIKAYVNFSQALNDTLGLIEPYVEIPGYTTLIDKKPSKLEYIIKKF